MIKEDDAEGFYWAAKAEAASARAAAKDVVAWEEAVARAEEAEWAAIRAAEAASARAAAAEEAIDLLPPKIAAGAGAGAGMAGEAYRVTILSAIRRIRKIAGKKYEEENGSLCGGGDKELGIKGLIDVLYSMLYPKKED